MNYGLKRVYNFVIVTYLMFLRKEPFMKNFWKYAKYIRLIFNNMVIRIFFRRPKMNKKYYASLCTIFKNEAPYLKEWVDYHLIVGFEHFYIYNNFSDDNYKEVLEPYIKKGLLTLIEWPIPAGQTLAYNDCVEKFSDESHWIAFQDADEFAVPVKYNNIKDWLKKFEKFPCVLGFYRNFSSNGVIHEDYKYVIETFTSCTKFKSPSMFLNTYHTKKIKYFKLTHFARFKFFNKVCAQYPAVFCGLTDEIKSPEFQFNHYYCKSYDYFVNKKMTRGDAYRIDLGRSLNDDFYRTELESMNKNFVIFKYLTKLKMFDLEEYCKEKELSKKSPE